MYLVLLLAAAAIIAGVVVIAMGRGGELVLVHRDLPLNATELRTPADVALVRLPLAPLGYQVQATSEALAAAARLLAAREAELSALRAELRRFGAEGPPAPADGIADGIPAANLDQQQGL